MSAIAADLGIRSLETVHRDLKRLGIKTRSHSEAGKLGARGRSERAREREREKVALREAAKLRRDERVEQAVVRYEEGASTLTIGAELGVSPDTVSCYLKERGIALRSLSDAARLRTDNEIRSAKLAQFNELRWAKRRDEIRAKATDCGNAACDVAGCSVPYGDCHQDGCGELAVISDESDVNKGWIKGEPKVYCLRHGPMRGVSVVEEVLRDAHERGCVTHGEAAEMLGIDRLAFHVRKGRIAPVESSNGFSLYRKAEVERCKSDMRERARRARKGKGDGRSALPFDPEIVVKHRRGRGWLALYAEEHRLSEEQAARLVRDEVQERRKLVLGGRPPKNQHREIGDLAELGENSFLAETGLLAWQRDLHDFRQRYPAGRGARDDPESPARGSRKPILDRIRGLIGQDAKALLIDAKKTHGA
jgi:predicted HTH domain antitoxin